MKKILFLICMLCVNAHAETISVNWLNENGTTYDTSTCTVGGDLNVPTAPTKRGHTFRGWAFYTPIEYIQGYTNVQYINTMIVPTSNMKIYTKVQYMGTSDSKACSVFGARSQSYLGIDFFIAPTNLDIDFFGTQQSDRWSINPNTATVNAFYEYSVENSNVQIIKNGSVIGTHQFTPTGSTSYSLFINATNNAGQPLANQLCNLRIYAFQIWQNGTIVRDMIPALDDAGVPCMFDKVSGQFFYNAGTGSFTAGPAI